MYKQILTFSKFALLCIRETHENKTKLYTGEAYFPFHPTQQSSTDTESTALINFSDTIARKFDIKYSLIF